MNIKGITKFLNKKYKVTRVLPYKKMMLNYYLLDTLHKTVFMYCEHCKKVRMFHIQNNNCYKCCRFSKISYEQHKEIAENISKYYLIKNVKL